MAYKFAKEIFSVGNGERTARFADKANDRGVKGTAVLVFSTTDDAGLHNIGGQDLSSSTADTCFLAAVGVGTPKFDGAVGCSGAIKIDAIELVSSSTIPNHATIAVQAYRNYSANGQWSDRIKTGATKSITYQPSTESSSITSTFDTLVLGSTLATASGAASSFQRVDAILRAGDVLALHGDGAGDVTAGVVDITVVVHYTRLTPGARLTGMGVRV